MLLILREQTWSLLDMMPLQRSNVLLVLEDGPILPVEVDLITVFVAQALHGQVHNKRRERQTVHLKENIKSSSTTIRTLWRFY